MQSVFYIGRWDIVEEDKNHSQAQTNKKAIVIVSIIVVGILVICIGIAVFVKQTGNWERISNQPETEVQSTEENSLPQTRITDGKGIVVTGSVEIPDDFNAVLFVKMGYELRYLFAIESFQDAKQDISVNKLVQYAFCHIYHESLTDANPGTMVLRSATATQINEQIRALFNIEGVDIKQSDLYNKGSDIFEMWEPSYTDDVYADASIAIVDNLFQITVKYYTDADKKSEKGTVVLSVQKSNFGYYINKMI